MGNLTEVLKELRSSKAPEVDEICPGKLKALGVEGLPWGIALLLFADYVVLLAPSVCGLQHSLDRFKAECEVAGMRISTSKSETMVLSKKLGDCPLPVKEFKYLGHLFTREGIMEQQIDWRTGAAEAVSCLPFHTI